MIRYKVEIEDKIYFKPLIGVTPQVADLGFSWNKKLEKWQAPISYIHLKSLVEMFPNDLEIDAKCEHLLNTEYGFSVGFSSSYQIPETALKHQEEAIDFLLCSPRAGSLLCLSPGLGKTYTAIVAAYIRGYKNVLIVSPLILLNTWVVEAFKWTGLEITNCYDQDYAGGYGVINYDQLVSRIDQIGQNSFDLIIFDESILLKNKSTKTASEIKEIESKANSRKRKYTRWQAAYILRKKADKCWMLSGSPTSKYADDLFGQLHILDPKIFSSYWRFTNRYCYVMRDQWGTKIVGTREDRNVQADLKDFMFVRNKKDVLDLPETYYETLYVKMLPKQQKAYDDLLNDFIAELEGTNEKITVTAFIAQITKLHQITSGLGNFDNWPDISAKSDALVELIKAEDIESPCVILCHYRKNAEHLYNRLKELNVSTELLLGGNKDKDAILTRAKNNEIDYLVASIETIKHGITLTNFKTMIYYEKNNNADSYLQSMERISRIGLTHNPLILSLHVSNSIEDWIADSLANKSQNIASISNYDLAQLLKGLGKDGK